MRWSFAVCLLAWVFACTGSPGEDGGRFLDGGLPWRRLQLPFRWPRPVEVLQSNGGARVVAIDGLGDGGVRIAAANWDGVESVTDVEDLARFSSDYIPTVLSNGGLSIDVAFFGADTSRVFLVDARATRAVEVFSAAYSVPPGSFPHIAVGAASEDGEVWVVRNTPYRLYGGMTSPCPGETIELFGAFADGGLSGRQCPFPDQWVDAGGPPTTFINAHPFQRLLSRFGVFAFATFSSEGRIAEVIAEPRPARQSFWPSKDGAPTVIAEVERDGIAIDTFEWRLVDAGVEESSSPLGGWIRYIRKTWWTPQGVVVEGLPPVDCRNSRGEVRLIAACGSGARRLLLVSEDLSKVLGVVDYAALDSPNGCSGAPDSVVDQGGKLFAFSDSMSTDEPRVPILCVAPIDLALP